jgi:hypothetical protein
MPTLPEYDPEMMVRVAYIMRVEAMVNVGCKYGPNDLDPSTWDHLLILASERAFVDRVVDARREKHKHSDAGMAKARQVTGAPAPGGTLFKPSHPFHGSTK